MFLSLFLVLVSNPTYAFQCDIKSAINKLINYTQYEIVKKEDVLQILNEGGKEWLIYD